MTQRTFTSGELTPELQTRADLALWYSGLKTCSNFYPVPQGGVRNRAGFEFVVEVDDSSVRHRIIDFSFNAQQTYGLVLGDYTLRVVADGGQVVLDTTPAAYNGATTYDQGDHVVDVGINYYSLQGSNTGNTPASSPAYWYALTDDIVEIKTPYAAADLYELDYTQSGDIITITHQSYPVHELVRLANDTWIIREKSFSPEITAPGAPTCTANGATGTPATSYSYLVRAVDGAGDSVDSAIVSCINATKTSMAGTSRAYNTVTWSAVAGATSYDVYIDDGGTYYLLATGLTSTAYTDQNANHTGTAKVAATGTIAAPTGVNAVATTSSNKTYRYKVTAIDADTGEESEASSEGTCINRDPFEQGDYNDISWSGVTGAGSYRVYKEYNGLFGYIGETPFRDDAIQPDVASTPPVDRALFSSSGNYPGCCEYFEQRLFLSGTANNPRTIYGTRSALFNNLTFSTPATDSDSIEFTLASKFANEVYFLAPLSYLLAITDRGALSILGQDGFLTPKQPPDIKQQGTVGTARVQPIMVHRSMLYVEGTGRRVFDIAYEDTGLGFGSSDRTIQSPHLFRSYGIIDWAYADAPNQIVWAVREDGTLLSFTYHREQEVFGWAHHHTDGEFESVTTIREGSEDAVYALVKREINGATKRYVERLHSREFTSLEDAFFVDSGLTYDGAAATIISGLDHLNGKTVTALADGFVVDNLTVTAGQITLPEEASKVHIGLPYTGDLETLEIDSSEGGFRNRKISVPHVEVNFYESRGGWIGPNDDPDDMVEILRDMDTATLFTGPHEQTILGTWETKGKVHIQQRDPLPMSIIGITPAIARSNG